MTEEKYQNAFMFVVIILGKHIGGKMRILVLLLVGLFLSNCSNSYVKSKKNITSPNDLMKFYKYILRKTETI